MTDQSSRIAVSFDGWILLREPLELLRAGRRQRLQELPLLILDLLASHPGQLVTREELIAKLWPKGVVEFDAGLNTAMRKLRAALGDDAETPRYIETVPRQGYRFVGHIVGAPPPPPLHSRHLHKEWLLVGVLLSVIALGWWLGHSHNHPRAVAMSPQTPRLAVLPFENLSPDPTNAFFTDGMHEEILSSLANVGNFDVVSRTTMMLYRKTPKPVSEIARELGITHVLEGSVRREGTMVRVTLLLIDAHDDRHLWSRNFDRELVHVMTLQSQIAAEVAAQLTTNLSRDSMRLPPPRNPEAYDLWLKAVLAWQNVGGGGATALEMQRVEDLYSRAIALDGEYAAAYADRCRVRIAKFANGTDQSDPNIEGARADLAMAQKLGGNSPHVLIRTATLAYLVDGDMGRALDLISAAEKIGPLNADFLLTKANFLANSRRLAESLETHEKAASLDPGNPGLFRFWMVNLFSAHRPEEAMKVAASFDERIPARIDRGELLFQYSGSTERWREEFNRLRRNGGADAVLSEEFDLLRYEQRFEELKSLVEHVGYKEFRQHSPSLSLIGSGPKPVAELLGWEALMSGDRAAAARQGKLVLAYVEQQTWKRWNAWSLHLLAAEGALFIGNYARAQSEVRESLASTGATPNHAVANYTRGMAARVLGWAGEQDEAMRLLDQLANGYPGVGPAAITRDPLLAKPLAANIAFQSLAQKLEAQIAANRTLL